VRISATIGLTAATAVGLFWCTCFAAAENPQVHTTRAGTEAAAAIVIKRSDLPKAAWSGGQRNAEPTGGVPGCKYQPKQKDLVVNGAAATDWRATGLEVYTESEVMATSGMVAKDFQRSFAPEIFPCIRNAYLKGLPAHARFVSFGDLTFPKLAQYQRVLRFEFEFKTKSRTVAYDFDVVLIGKGRTEISLAITAPAAAPVAALDLRLAHILLARVPSDILAA
jgi:hypothetical protein